MSFNAKEELDPDKFDFPPFDPSIHDFSSLDFRYKGQDPLCVHAFIHGDPQDYVKNHVSTIHSVLYDGKLIGFFTISMAHIGSKDINDFDIPKEIPFPYPALLLGQMGIEENSRSNDIGIHIVNFCLGLGQLLDEKIACAFLILRTSNILAEKYYEPKCEFNWVKSNKPKVWMYRKLF